MTLYNPLMPWLNPRSSGLIAFKGGGASAEEVQTAVDSGTAAVNENTNQGFAEVAEMGDTITSNQDTMLDNQAGLASGQTEILGSIAAIPQTQVVSQTVDTSGIENRIGSLEGTTDRGFADVGGRLDTVDNTLTGVQGSVDQGFSNMNNSFNTLTEGQQDLQGNITDLSNTTTTGLADLGSTVNTGFTDTQNAINTGFTNQGQALDTASANILGGQANLQSFLDDLSGRQDIYYGGLAEGQSNILNDVGGLQTAFTGFRNQYDGDTALANRSRADLQEMVTGGIGTLREEMAEANDSASRARKNIQDAVNTGTQAAQRGAGAQAAATLNFGKALADITAGAQPQSMGELTVARDVVNRLGVIRQVLSAPNNMDANMRDQYTKLANSFDETGALIPRSVDAQGSTTDRAIDQRSNLLLATRNNQGQLIDQSAIDMNQLFGAMDQLGYSGTGNATGGLSPQNLANRNVAVNTGFAAQNEPFFRTTG